MNCPYNTLRGCHLGGFCNSNDESKAGPGELGCPTSRLFILRGGLSLIDYRFYLNYNPCWHGFRLWRRRGPGSVGFKQSPQLMLATIRYGRDDPCVSNINAVHASTDVNA